MRIIIVGKIHECLVDDQDYESLSRFNWFLGTTGYAHRNSWERINGVGKNHIVKMHRVIIQAPARQIVDHIDGNPLNNQRGNLRLATPTQNNMNQAVRRDNHSGARGISRDRKWWRARIMVAGKERLLGRFLTMEAAVVARDTAERETFGEYAPVVARTSLAIETARQLNVTRIRQ
jgi:hypothetical protein